ncbi:MAG: hypothetical protein ACKO1N_04980 [Erythrobacter sp.]
MTDDVVGEGGSPVGGERSNWIINLNIGPFAPSSGFPPQRRVVEGLHLVPGLYEVTLENAPDDASAYGHNNGKDWLKHLFVIVASGEEVGRQALGEPNKLYRNRAAAQKAFNEFDLSLRRFAVHRVSTVLIHPILVASGNSGQLKVRISKLP